MPAPRLRINRRLCPPPIWLPQMAPTQPSLPHARPSSTQPHQAVPSTYYPGAAAAAHRTAPMHDQQATALAGNTRMEIGARSAGLTLGSSVTPGGPILRQPCPTLQPKQTAASTQPSQQQMTWQCPCRAAERDQRATLSRPPHAGDLFRRAQLRAAATTAAPEGRHQPQHPSADYPSGSSALYGVIRCGPAGAWLHAPPAVRPLTCCSSCRGALRGMPGRTEGGWGGGGAEGLRPMPHCLVRHTPVVALGGRWAGG
jgi:hypothetical protein